MINLVLRITIKYGYF